MRKLVIGILILLPFAVLGQEADSKFKAAPDVHVRMYWMSTSYPDTYKDDYALGTSLKLGAKLNYTKNLEFRVGYRISANLWSSNLTQPDPVSGGIARYEPGLFDLLNPEDKFFGNLETLSLTYSKNNWGISAGRMAINTDWINGQDGRLDPNAIEGGKLWYATESKWKFTAWGIGKVSVRGTSEWLGVGESIGVFPVARGVDGKPSQYGGNTHSDWIGIAEVDKKWKGLDLHVSNTFVQNISNTLWTQLQRNWSTGNPSEKWLVGIQAGFQAGLGNGGNSDPSLQYKNPEDLNWTFSTRLGYSISNWNFHLNYTKTGGDGRWLSPREWGKDAWYTFIPRERNEGNQSFDALVAYSEYHFEKANLTAFVHLGFYWLPDITDPKANKYNSSSYRQLNVGLKYKPSFIDKLDGQLLVMNKEQLGNEQLKPGQEYNKIGMIHVNAIVNWRIN